MKVFTNIDKNIHTCIHIYIHTYTQTRSTNLARQVAKADSGTCGPHSGSRPLHLVFAFCSSALCHSSLPRACLKTNKNQDNEEQIILVFVLRCDVSRFASTYASLFYIATRRAVNFMSDFVLTGQFQCIVLDT